MGCECFPVPQPGTLAGLYSLAMWKQSRCLAARESVRTSWRFHAHTPDTAWTWPQGSPWLDPRQVAGSSRAGRRSWLRKTDTAPER